MTKHLLILLLTVITLPVFGQTTDFTYQNSNSNSCLPIDIQFTQISAGAPVGYLWDFGNGTKSNSANPVVTFTAAGYYSVRLITVYANSTAEKRKTIQVRPSITTSFQPDRNKMCQPGTVNFTAVTSGDLENYVWDFGDGSGNITNTSNTISHNYTGFGSFTVNLRATSNNGCSVTHSATIDISKPTISGSISTPLLGCIPMQTNLNASVISLTGSNVSSYSWNFGDGGTLNTTSGTSTHNYNQVGSFSPTLSIVTTDGCNASFSFDSVSYGRPPINHNAYPADTVFCGSDIPVFFSNATNANRYDWNFGGGGLVSVTDTMVEHRYTTLGPKSITVTPLYNGCPGTSVNFDIEIIGVIARYTYKNTCEDKKTFVFNNSSQGHISTINWSLGNQGYSTNIDSVSHTYPQTGTFPVKLLITDNITGCVDSFKSKIYTANPVMENPDASICINSSTTFSVLNNYSNPALTYLWNVLGTQVGPGLETAPTITATALGHFDTSQVILNNGGQYCPDTVRLDHPITIRGPQLDFTAPASICINTPLSVVNLSHPFQPADSINAWYWNFGRAGANDSSFQPQPFQYSIAKAYNVKLTAVDIYGCMDSLVKKVFVRPMPFLWIIPKMDTICEGQSSTMIGYTSDQISWTSANPLNFCSSCDTTTVRPVSTTKFYATSTNIYNCVSTDSSMVKVSSPFTANALSNDSAVCEGGKVPLSAGPVDKIITWSPASSLSNPNIFNPVASPAQSTVYTATLTDSLGCFSSTANITVTVKSKPTVEAGGNKIYPYSTNFSLSPIYSSNVRTWLWSPADSLSCSTCPFPIGIAATTKTYTIQVVSDSGCVATDNITVSVECNGVNLLMPSAFTPNNDGLNDLYYPITRGIRNVNRFVIYNREGQIMYEKRNFLPNKDTFGWDGRFRGQALNPAAFVYVIEAECDLGQSLSAKGSFVLVR